VTQNFVSDVNLPHVLKFLASGNADLVSGCAVSDRAGLHQRFLSALRRERPDLMARLHEQERHAQQAELRRKQLSSLFRSEEPASKKAEITALHVTCDAPEVVAGGGIQDAAAAAPFSFQFAGCANGA